MAPVFVNAVAKSEGRQSQNVSIGKKFTDDNWFAV